VHPASFPDLRRLLCLLLLLGACLPVATFAAPPSAGRNLVPLKGVTAPNAQLVAPAAVSFARARNRLIAWCGRDYLAQLDEALRPVDFVSNKPGVAALSWHKAGRAIDVRQTYRYLAVVTDAKYPRYKRLLIRCVNQDGSQGWYFGPKTLGRRATPGWYVDLTGIMLAEGWNRIPAQGNVGEWWHFEYRAGARSWQHAMSQVYPISTLRRLYPRSF
jgi:hypothetical protein